MKTTVITDFSKTLTSSDNPTTWSVLALSGVLGKDYNSERDILYKKNYAYEQLGHKEKTRDWFATHLAILKKYLLTQKIIDQVVRNSELFEPRKGLYKFFEYISKNNIQLIIITSGISNFVQAFLESQNISTESIQIIGNELLLDPSGKVTGYNTDSVFTPLDDKGSFPHPQPLSFGGEGSLKEENKVYLLGDKPEDLAMYSGKKLSIGFNEAAEGYDLNLGKQGNLEEVIEIMKNK